MKDNGRCLPEKKLNDRVVPKGGLTLERISFLRARYDETETDIECWTEVAR
jgi:hypothetical protein